MLVVSYIGYDTQEVPVGTRTEIQIALRENATQLDDVVVVGYGVVKKRDVSTAISSIKAEDLANSPNADFRQTMAGKMPGVGICFDTNHYVQGTTGHFMDIAGKRIRTLHCSDFDFVNECHWLPTQGDIDWEEFVRRLRGIGYDGVFMYEAIKDLPTQGRLQPGQIMESYRVLFPAQP